MGKGRNFLYIMIGIIVLVIIASVYNQTTKVLDLGSTCPQELITITPNFSIEFRNVNFANLQTGNWSGISRELKNGYLLDSTQGGCHLGKDKGENLNLYYCSYYFSKKIISDSGEIGKTHYFNIHYIFDKEGNLVEKKCV